MVTLWKVAVVWCSIVIPMYYLMPVIEATFNHAADQAAVRIVGQ